MIKYNTQLLTDALLLKTVAKWIKKGIVQADSVQNLNIDINMIYKQNNLLKRIGLFLASFLSIWGIIGFFSLFLFQLASSNLVFFGIITVLFGAGLMFYLEQMIKYNYWFKHGTDDAILFNGIFCSFSGILLIVTPNINQTTFLFETLLLILIIAMVCYRYLNWFYAVVTVLLINSLPIQILALINTQLLFFAALVLVPLNIFILKMVKKYDCFKNHYFSDCFKYIKYAACVLMYFSVNLYVIKETASHLLGVNAIPVQGLFLTLTIALPLIFIALGLYCKQKFLLLTGLFLLLPTIATVRFYYSVMPIELALTFGGLVLIIFSYFSIKRIQKNNTPFTFVADEDEDLSLTELILIGQQFGSKSTELTSHKTFGGGTFGGAGAEGNFES